MTAHATDLEDPTESEGGSWHATLLTAAEPGRRNRRTIDAVIMSVAALLIGLAAVIAHSAPTVDDNVEDAPTTVLGWARRRQVDPRSQIALTQRLGTFYLPPIWGYFSLRWLSRKGYV